MKRKFLILATVVLCLFSFGNKAMALDVAYNVGNSYADHQCWNSIASQVVKTGYIELNPYVYNGTFHHYNVYLRNVIDMGTNIASWTDITSTSQSSQRCGVTINTAGTYRVCIVVYDANENPLVNTAYDGNSYYNFTVVSSTYPFVSTGSSSIVTCNSAYLSGGCNVSGYGCQGVRYRVNGSSSWTYVTCNGGTTINGLSQGTTYQWTYWGDYSRGIEGGEVNTFTTLSTPLTPGAITGPTSVCAGDGQKNYYVPQVSGATSYTWSYPSGWSFSGYYYDSSRQYDVYLTPGSNAQSGYVRVTANNSCGSSPASEVYVTVNTPPTAPTGISASVNPICSGGSTTLTATGGSTGSGCTYQWGTGSCGSNVISGQTGSSITVSPASTTTYWVRRVGTSPCGSTTTSCVSVTVTVNTPPTAPTGISGTNTIKKGQSTTLTATGGSEGSGCTYQWYSGSCGGVSVPGTGSSITVSPESNTTYYVRRVGTSPCGSTTTTCAPSVTVTVSEVCTNPTAPTSISASVNPICSGGSTTLTATGGSTGSGCIYEWGTGSCGSNVISGQTGSSITVSPTSTTTYWVRRKGTVEECTATTSCATLNVTVNTPPTAPTGISGTSAIQQGQSTTLTATGGSEGSGCTYQWGTGSCGSNVISGQTGSSITVSPASTTTYWVRRVGTSPCGSTTTTCATQNVTVIPPGNETYDITASAGSGGKIDPNGKILVSKGGSQIFFITPNSGYQIEQVKVDGSDKGAVSSYTFENVTEEHTISASFSPIPGGDCDVIYTITATAGNNGSIFPNGQVTVCDCDNKTFVFEPERGYKINRVFIDDLPVSTDDYYTFQCVSANHKILVTFAPVAIGVDDADTDTDQLLQIFPNPTYDDLFIQSELQIERVEVYSLTGALLMQENNFNEKISVSTLLPGVYLLKVYTGKGVVVSKVVRE